MKKIFAFIIAVCIALTAVIPAFAAEPVLSFDENGEFKILHLCDCQDGYPHKEKLTTYINYMLEIYEPDLVVLGGDNAVGLKETKEEEIKSLVAPFVEHETYFTLVFGNHDHEQGVDKETLLKYYQKHGGKYCLAYDADPSLHGTAIHNLPVYSSDGKEIKFNVWMFDTGDYVYDENGNRLGYDSVTPDQIEWYKKTSEEIGKVPSMAFQHMVVGEVYEAMYPSVPFELSPITESYNGKIYPIIFPDTSVFKGYILEAPSPGVYNHGLFDAMLENGDVVAIFSGHDHINTYEVDYKGIKIINTSGISFSAYGNEFVRGSRLITVYEDNPADFESEIITVNGLAYRNKDFADDIGISKAEAGAWIFLGNFHLLLKNLSSLISLLIYW